MTDREHELFTRAMDQAATALHLMTIGMPEEMPLDQAMNTLAHFQNALCAWTAFVERRKGSPEPKQGE